jgi:hypothetical protein
VAPERTILDGQFIWLTTLYPMSGGINAVAVDEPEFTQSAVRAHRTLLARASTVTFKEGTAS